ncbi:23S rRNA (guanosine(2251)-2'-O)-methyltransferase RlmB [Allohahella marinimesophila]|uniref:23S rRNA (Guanosine(2251)-2'-O)-methyltransferase RlmB n=1 Tax=Allohahella marinimesophila TaxID=1054972 RepID=A0ABP7PQI9_9GAMM
MARQQRNRPRQAENEAGQADANRQGPRGRKRQAGAIKADAGGDSAAYVYGIHAVASLLSHRPEAILRLCVRNDKPSQKLAELLGQIDEAVKASNGQLQVSRVDGPVLDDMVPGVHQGVVAEVRPLQEQGESALDELLDRWNDSASPLRLLVLDGVTDPHNLGACLRSACAAGVAAVIMPKDRSASLTAVARKVAVGAAELVPVIRVTNLARTLGLIQQYGVWIAGADGEAENSIFQLKLPDRVAFVLGSEGRGMRRLTRESCDQLFSIPMPGAIESLNVSVACGVTLFESVRQSLPIRP